MSRTSTDYSTSDSDYSSDRSYGSYHVQTSTEKNQKKMLHLTLRSPTPSDYIKTSTKKSVNENSEEEIEKKELTEEEKKDLYSRSDEILSSKTDKKIFFKREKSLPPPRTGKIVSESFPPKVKIEKPKELEVEENEMKKELKVVRFMPSGTNLNVVSVVSVTFNQPMIPVSSVDELKKFKSPIKITPSIKGEFRWIGTQTVTWKPIHRFPKSTLFNVTSVDGIKSEYGCELKKKLSFSFSTVPLRIKTKYPSSAYQPISPNGIIFIEFNQKIDKKNIFKFLKVNSSKFLSKKMKLKPLSEKEVENIMESDSGEMEKKLPSMYYAYKNFLKNSIKKNSIWFTFIKKLSLDTNFTCNLLKGAIGAEGDRKTIDTQSFTFKTYSSMKMVERYPRNGLKIIPMQNWSIYFSNNIELDEFNPDEIVSITPKVEDLKITASGRYINIKGKTKGRTKYEVVINKKLRDVYGQFLEKIEKTVFSVGPANKMLQGFF